MDPKATSFIFLCFFFALAGGATITRLEGVKGTIKFIETDSNFYTYIITNNTFGDHFYALNSRNRIILEKDFRNITSVKFNNRNKLHLFDAVEKNKTSVWVFQRSYQTFIPTLTLLLNYTSAYPGFFDNDGNLFFESASGISILRHDETVPNVLEYLEYFTMMNNASYTVDKKGNVYLGLVTKDKPIVRVVAQLDREEISQPDPMPYFYYYSTTFGDILQMTAFNNSIAFKTPSQLLMLQNDNFYLVYSWSSYYPSAILQATSEKLFYQYYTCYIYYAKPTRSNFQVQYFPSCQVAHAFDKEGNAFFASISESRVSSIWRNGTSLTTLNVPNTLFIRGLSENGKGDVWVLAQSLYYIPRGSKDGTKVINLPFARKFGPIIAKKGTDDVFVALDDKLYLISKLGIKESDFELPEEELPQSAL